MSSNKEIIDDASGVGQPKVLIVEDEKIFAMELEELVDSLGYQVVGVADRASTALSISERCVPDIALVDIKIEGDEDGVTLAEKIADNSDAAIIFLTAHPGEEYVSRALKCSPYAYLLKPIDGREIKLSLRSAMKLKSTIAGRRELAQKKSDDKMFKSIGLLAAGIAHELNNRLMAIISNVSLARHKIEEPNIARGYLKTAEDSVFRTRELADRLLTFAPGGAPIREEFDLVEYIRNNTAQFEEHISSPLIIKLPMSAPAIYANEIHLGQVINHLLENANQATPEKEAILLEVSSPSAEELGRYGLENDRYLCLAIADSGVGINENIIDSVFDPFFSTKGAGRGLGLATCRSIVERHGGGIYINSEQGRGTRVKIFLPVFIKSDEPV